MNTMSLALNRTYWESPKLFLNEVVPPIIVVFCQSQSRLLGEWKKSAQKFEMPGGWFMKDDKLIPRLDSLKVILNGNDTQDGFYTSITDRVSKGLLKRFYIAIFKMLR